MKNNTCCLFFLFLCIGLFSCEKEVEADRLQSSGKPFAGTSILPRIISSPRTLHKDTLYRITGIVWVTPGNTLTIEAGVRIECSKQLITSSAPAALVILPAAYLQCNGTAAEPIVFTSNATKPAPGDWGGILLIGQAGGQYGGRSLMKMLSGFNRSADSMLLRSDSAWRYGNNITDNSGSVTYTRIEYAGFPGYISPLTLCGTGRGTTISFVEAAWSRNHAFEFRGGTTPAHHLISLCPTLDAFSTTMGYRGCLSFSLSLTHSQAADSTLTDFTVPKAAYNRNSSDSGVLFNHLTVIGLPASPPPFYRAGWHSNSGNTAGYSVTGSLFLGYLPNTVSGASKSNNISFVRPSRPHNYTENNDSIQLISPWDWADFRPASGSPAASGNTLDTTGYKGAFAPDAFPWTGSWARFDYQTGPTYGRR